MRLPCTSDTLFKGQWIKDKTSHACESEKAGSQYWGSLKFDFESSDRDEFDDWPHAERIL